MLSCLIMILVFLKNARVHTIYEIKTSEDFELDDDNI